MSIESNNISSAEMTAYWRSLFPKFSHDPYSIHLASPDGILKAKEFEQKFDYPLVGRKVSVRAGYILKKAKELLSTGEYDSCISLASGFSLLTYCIARDLGDAAQSITFYDTDFSHMIKERKKRIQMLSHDILSDGVLEKIKAVPLDLEEAYRDDKNFKTLFPDCKRPLFIVEGAIYFLTENCVNWIMKNIHSFNKTALIFDYWPKNGVDESACFKRVVDSLKDFIPETIKSFWDEQGIANLSKYFYKIEDEKIGSIENKMSIDISESPQFTDQQAFFPIKFITAS